MLWWKSEKNLLILWHRHAFKKNYFFNFLNKIGISNVIFPHFFTSETYFSVSYATNIKNSHLSIFYGIRKRFTSCGAWMYFSKKKLLFIYPKRDFKRLFFFLFFALSWIFFISNSDKPEQILFVCLFVCTKKKLTCHFTMKTKISNVSLSLLSYFKD